MRGGPSFDSHLRPAKNGAASIVAIGGTLSGAEWYAPESKVLTSAFSPLEPIAVCAMLWSELLRRALRRTGRR